MMKKIILVSALILLVSCQLLQQTNQNSNKTYVLNITNNETTKSETKVSTTAAESKKVNVTENQWIGIQIGKREIVLRFEGIRENSAVLKMNGSNNEVTLYETINYEGVNITVTNLWKDKTTKELGSQVRLWLGTKNGAIPDMLEERQNNTYTTGDKTYNVSVKFIGEGQNEKPRVLFKINGENTKTLKEGETTMLNQNEFILIREILYRDNPVRVNLDKAELQVEI